MFKKNEPIKRDSLAVYHAKKRAVSISMRLFRLCMIITMSYLFMFPLYYMLVVSFQRPDLAVDPTSVYVPKAFSTEAYKIAFKQLDYKNSALLSLIISVFSTALTAISCSLTGYAFARFEFKGKKIAFLFVMLLIVIPPQQIIVPQYLMYKSFNFGGLLSLFGVELNLLNTPFVFVLPSMFAVGLKAGIFIFIFRQFFLGQPRELEEAAKIDGCGALQTFIKVMAPLAKPAFVVVIMLCIIWHWNDYYSSSMFFIDKIKPVMVCLERLRQNIVEMGTLPGLPKGNYTPVILRMYLQAGVVLTITPPLFLYVFMQKQFVESIDRTGIVG
ncbi:MAG TPA: carbohydrate ABC transporter permease [Ruminococcaceae bacterium]|nr:carbohydrate ABC transporter permease [Oscillospiraceae bacterium]